MYIQSTCAHRPRTAQWWSIFQGGDLDFLIKNGLICLYCQNAQPSANVRCPAHISSVNPFVKRTDGECTCNQEREIYQSPACIYKQRAYQRWACTVARAALSQAHAKHILVDKTTSTKALEHLTAYVDTLNMANVGKNTLDLSITGMYIQNYYQCWPPQALSSSHVCVGNDNQLVYQSLACIYPSNGRPHRVCWCCVLFIACVCFICHPGRPGRQHHRYAWTDQSYSSEKWSLRTWQPPCKPQPNLSANILTNLQINHIVIVLKIKRGMYTINNMSCTDGPRSPIDTMSS